MSQYQSRTPPPPVNQRSSGEHHFRGNNRHVNASSEASRDQGEWRSREFGRAPDDRRGLHDRPPHMRSSSPLRAYEADAKRRRVADDPDSTLARRRIHEDDQPSGPRGNGASANDPASSTRTLPHRRAGVLTVIWLFVCLSRGTIRACTTAPAGRALYVVVQPGYASPVCRLAQ